jgi:hypothetical protein
MPAAAADLSICDTLGNLARSIMSGRQEGVSITTMLKVSNGNRLTDAMIMEAYRQPMYQTPEIIDRVVAEFVDKTQNDCVRALRGKK